MREKAFFDTPSNYRIIVQGRIQADWHERFGLMQVTTHQKADDVISILDGSVSDQTELAGILNTLYELHLPLISVQLQDEDS